jgi:hypothetical protein
MFMFNVNDLFHIQQPLWLYGGLTKRVCMYVCDCVCVRSRACVRAYP